MIFEEFKGRFFYNDYQFSPIKNIKFCYLMKGESYYEVLRIIDGKPLFLSDHIERFFQSVKHTKYYNFVHEYNYSNIISELCLNNNINEGNIKIVLNVTEKPSLYIYFIPHRYPSETDYKKGVRLSSKRLERTNPEIKQVNLSLRKLTESIMHNQNAYDVLLIDYNSNITECSKSNIFFVKNDRIYTPPVNLVLPGITRKYVLKICETGNIAFTEKYIEYNSVRNFDSVFITGTSPKILPVREIDNIHFSANNIIIQFIIEKYEEIIRKNISLV